MTNCLEMMKKKTRKTKRRLRRHHPRRNRGRRFRHPQISTTQSLRHYSKSSSETRERANLPRPPRNPRILSQSGAHELRRPSNYLGLRPESHTWSSMELELLVDFCLISRLVYFFVSFCSLSLFVVYTLYKYVLSTMHIAQSYKKTKRTPFINTG